MESVSGRKAKSLKPSKQVFSDSHDRKSQQARHYKGAAEADRTRSPTTLERIGYTVVAATGGKGGRDVRSSGQLKPVAIAPAHLPALLWT